MTDIPVTKFEQTHVSLVLDRSGSMKSAQEETIGAVNGYLADARKDPNLKECDFELALFDAQGPYEVIRAGAPCNLKDITAEDFVPRGYTPLFDAVGRGISSLDERLAKTGDKKAILVVVTDGFENSSKEFTLKKVQELIADKRSKGWLVIFLGAGLEAAQQGLNLGFKADTIANIGLTQTNLQSVRGAVYAMNSAYASMDSFEDAAFVAEGASFSDEDRKAMGDDTAGGGLTKKPRFSEGQPGGFGGTLPPRKG